MKLESQWFVACTSGGHTPHQAALLPACIHSSGTSVRTTDYRDEEAESVTSLCHNKVNISQANEHLNFDHINSPKQSVIY